MNTDDTLNQQPIIKSFYEFARLDNNEKSMELMSHGLLLDKDQEKERSVNLYYLNGFFVEETISKALNRVVDIIPYKHGFRLETFNPTKSGLPSRRFQP